MNTQRTESNDKDSATLERLATMEALLVSQQDEISELKHQLNPDVFPEGTPSTDPEIINSGQLSAKCSAQASSRRLMLKRSAVAAGAVMAGAVVAPKSALAADGDNIVLGANNTSSSGNTRVLASGATDYSNRNIFTVSDESSSSAFEAAIGAYGEGDRVYNGLYAYSGGRLTNDSNTGHALVARNSGGRSNLLLSSGGSTPSFDTFINQRGSLRNVSGTLWYCTNSGTPGTWKRLAGPQSSGALHVISPSRVYDSRISDGRLPSSSERVVSVANQIDPSSGTVTLFNVVPAGATAVHFNLTITQTIGGGFILIAPGDATSVTASTINWGNSGVTVANASLSTLDDNRQIKALSGGAGQAHFIIDITGYTI